MRVVYCPRTTQQAGPTLNTVCSSLTIKSTCLPPSRPQRCRNDLVPPSSRSFYLYIHTSPPLDDVTQNLPPKKKMIKVSTKCPSRNKPIFLILLNKKSFFFQIPLEVNEANRASPPPPKYDFPSSFKKYHHSWGERYGYTRTVEWPACNSLELKTSMEPKQESGAKT